jgi:hypothetical protein
MMTDHFPSPLQGEFLNNGRCLMLTDNFLFVDGDTSILVPSGFVCDFNSVPRGLWNYFPPWEYPEAGVVHDFLYRYAPNDITRVEADQIHRRILEIGGASWVKRNLSYRFLRLGAGGAWDRYRAGKTGSTKCGQDSSL